MPIVRVNEGGVGKDNQNRKETKIYLKHMRNKCKTVLWKTISI